MPPATANVMDALAGSLDNLALAATSNKTAVQHLTVANLALTTSVSTLTAANKKLTKTVAHFNLNLNPRGGGGGRGSEGVQRNGPKAIWGNCCWTHGYKVLHNSATCCATGQLPGHDEPATVVDTKGGKDWNKDWYLRGKRDT
jgi:hypothetical protein